MAFSGYHLSVNLLTFFDYNSITYLLPYQPYQLSEQEAHGPHRSPENQFKSMKFNTFERSYDYIMKLAIGTLNFVNVFSLLRNYLTLEKGGVLHLNKLIYPSSKASYQLKVSDLPLQNEESFI